MPITQGIFKLQGPPLLILGSRVEKGGQGPKVSESKDWLVSSLMVLERKESIVCLIFKSLFTLVVNSVLLLLIMLPCHTCDDPCNDDALLFTVRSLPRIVSWLGSHTKNVNAVVTGFRKCYHISVCAGAIYHTKVYTKVWAGAIYPSKVKMVEDLIMDSGASFHATYCKKELERFNLRSGKVCLADEKTLYIAGVGDIVLKTSFGTIWNPNDVRYIPGLKTRLISFGQLNEEGYRVGFVDQQWKVTKGSLVVARGNKRRSLYMVEAHLEGISAIIDGSGSAAL
nr:retrovirus-related Pol polyprotein from transposon TNT 1-94 [Tanacetum cinerariifolium]